MEPYGAKKVVNRALSLSSGDNAATKRLGKKRARAQALADIKADIRRAQEGE